MKTPVRRPQICYACLPTMSRFLSFSWSIAGCVILLGQWSPGSPAPQFKLLDQHGLDRTLQAGTRTILFSPGKRSAKIVKAWLKDKPPGFLSAQAIQYVADISSMPPHFKNEVAIPRLQRFPQQILLRTDPSNQIVFPAQRYRVTVIHLGEDRRVDQVLYAKTLTDLLQHIGKTPHR